MLCWICTQQFFCVHVLFRENGNCISNLHAKQGGRKNASFTFCTLDSRDCLLNDLQLSAMSERPSRNAGKRSYAAEESDVASEKADSESEEEVPTSRRTKRQRPTKANCVTPTAGGFNEENSSDDDVAISRKKTPYECGQILRVDVENFMCHRKFTLKLGRNLNFINGRNGSGMWYTSLAVSI